MSPPEALITTLAPWKSWGLARARIRARSLTGLLGAGTAPGLPCPGNLGQHEPAAAGDETHPRHGRWVTAGDGGSVNEGALNPPICARRWSAAGPPTAHPNEHSVCLSVASEPACVVKISGLVRGGPADHS